MDVTFDRKKAPPPMESPTDDWLKVTITSDSVAQNAPSWMTRKVGGKFMAARETADEKADPPTVVSIVWLTSNACSE
jgi:hypothetical protein